MISKYYAIVIFQNEYILEFLNITTNFYNYYYSSDTQTIQPRESTLDFVVSPATVWLLPEALRTFRCSPTRVCWSPCAGTSSRSSAGHSSTDSFRSTTPWKCTWSSPSLPHCLQVRDLNYSFICHCLSSSGQLFKELGGRGCGLVPTSRNPIASDSHRSRPTFRLWPDILTSLLAH